MKTFGLVAMGALLAAAAVGCGASTDAVVEGSEAAVVTTRSPIKHVVLVVQENHSFDSYFGAYCRGQGGRPSCHDGPDCCEAPPAKITGHLGIATSPQTLDDDSNYDKDRNHDSQCELAEMDCDPNGDCKMDRYIDGPQYLPAYDLMNPCAQDANWAIAPGSAVSLYHSYAKTGALADAYFQPVAGQTSSNDMFFATAQYEFLDNSWFPDRLGADCQTSQSSDPLASKPEKHVIRGRKTIADLLLAKGPNGFAYYHEGYQKVLDGAKNCTLDKHGCPQERPVDCPHYLFTSLPCFYDPSDDPFKYFEQFGDDSPAIKDYERLAEDIQAGTLPSVAYVKAVMYKNEHPGWAKLSQGQDFVQQTVDAVLSSRYRDDTLVLVTWDEGGGFYDHVSPPIASDGRRMGTRVPLLALGKFARKSPNGYVSHVVMEHSSIVKFLEWNFLGGATGQLGGREDSVKNIGSMLDPALGVPDGE